MQLRYQEPELPETHIFSLEHKMKLSVVITSLNEPIPRLNQTIETIKENSNNEVEIIVVDDYSDNIVSGLDPSIKLFRNNSRIGCAPSRHFGATQASGEYLLFTDAHMIFHPRWYSEWKSTLSLINSTTTVCGTCIGLDDKHDTLLKSCGSYNGARLSLYEKNENQILEGKWIQEKVGEDLYEISCMMGAIYFINKDYFFKLRGLSDLKMWGSDEPCLALKILRSGGKMIISKKIMAGHFFRESSPYVTGMQYLVYNKIRMARTLLPDDIGQKLIDKFPRDGNFNAAMVMIENERSTIEEYKQYYKSIFIKSLDDICTEYNIENI